METIKAQLENAEHSIPINVQFTYSFSAVSTGVQALIVASNRLGGRNASKFQVKHCHAKAKIKIERLTQ